MLRPSNAPRWVRCAGSARGEAGEPDQPDDAAAREGTAAHWLATQWTGGLADLHEVAPNGVQLTDEHVQAARLYVDTVGAGAIHEQRMATETFGPLIEGTPDAIDYDRDTRTVRVWDFKYGRGVVESVDNYQTLIYSAMLHATDAERYELTIVQPRAYHPDGPVRTWTIPAAEYPRHIEIVRDSALNAVGDNPLTRVGPQCRYCRARWKCNSLQVAGADAADRADAAAMIDQPIADAALEYTYLSAARNALEYRLAALDERLLETIRTGGTVPGYTATPGRGSTHWNLPVDAIAAAGDLVGVDVRKPPDVITPRQAIKAGVSADVVASISEKKPGALKLAVDNRNELARKVFT